MYNTHLYSGYSSLLSREVESHFSSMVLNYPGLKN